MTGGVNRMQALISRPVFEDAHTVKISHTVRISGNIA